MTPRSYINILTIIYCLTFILSSCVESQSKKVDQGFKNKTNQVDTSKTTIIKFDKIANYPFDNSYDSTNLTQEDINNIDSLLIICVTDFNNSLNKDLKELRIGLKKNNYRKQLIAVKNKKGEKEVWVNCIYHNWDEKKWKTNISHIEDVENCYFNFKINLRTKEIYELAVNNVE